MRLVISAVCWAMLHRCLQESLADAVLDMELCGHGRVSFLYSRRIRACDHGLRVKPGFEAMLYRRSGAVCLWMLCDRLMMV